MPRLPSPLQPAWPVLKRGHRLLTRAAGPLTRRLPAPADRATPRRGTSVAEDTVQRDPGRARLHVGGPPEALRRSMPTGTPPDHWVFERWRSFDVPRRFTLELEGGSVVGDYAAHISADGTLDYETSTYFGVDGWREHPVFLRPRLPRPTRFEGTVASLATRGSSANYYHFLLDVLPRLGVLDECLPGEKVDAWFVNRATSYQRQLLELVGLGEVVAIDPAPDVAVYADRLLVPCIPNPELMAPTWTTTWLRERLPPQRSGTPPRLYVSRGDKRNSRRVANEEAVLGVLEGHGFVRFDPGAHSVQEQIDHFAGAEAVVAPHGAALANLVFAAAGVSVLELFAPRYVNPCYWAIAANVPDCRYRYLVCGTDSRRPPSPQNGVLTDITVDLDQLMAAVEELLGD